MAQHPDWHLRSNPALRVLPTSDDDPKLRHVPCCQQPIYLLATFIPGGELWREEAGGVRHEAGEGRWRAQQGHANPNPTKASARPTCEGDDQRIVVEHLDFIFVLLPLV